MKLGYSRIDITPTEPVHLGGYGNSAVRVSQNILSPLCSACAAFTDDNGTAALLVQNDLVSSREWFTDPVRQAISEETGVPFENIIIHATHTHSAPDLGYKKAPENIRYLEMVQKRIVENAALAMADQKPITGAEMTKTHTKGLNFVRHYVLEDGTYKGDNFGDLNPSPYAGHTTEPDTEMRLVKLHREGGEDVLLVNWQSHPHRTGGSKKYDVSADIVGAMRDELEEALGCKFIYFTGGAGNINPRSRIPEENITADYLEQGKALARCALEAEQRYQPLELDSIRVCTQHVWEPLNKPDESIVGAAQAVWDYWLETYDSPASKKVANSYGLNSQYAAAQLVRRFRMEEDGRSISFTALSFGDLAFVAVPYEMFDTNAKYVRDSSPFPMTIVASCANGVNNYVPSAYGFIHGCYEADSCLFHPGAGERFAYAMAHMLQSLK